MALTTKDVYISGSVSDFTATGSVSFTAGLSGSLTTLTDGTSYLAGGTNVTITSASNGQIIIDAGGGISTITAGAGLSGGGSSSTVTLTVDSRIVPDLTGANVFTGTNTFGTTGANQLEIGSGNAATGSLFFRKTNGDDAEITFNASEHLLIRNNKSDGDIIFNANDGGTDTEVFRVDGSAATVAIGETTNTVAKLLVKASSTENHHGIKVDQDDSGERAIWIDSEGQALYATCKEGIQVVVDVDDGWGGIFSRNKAADATGDPLVKIRDQDGDQQALRVLQESLDPSAFAIAAGNVGGVKTTISGSGAAGIGTGTSTYSSTLHVKSINEGDGIVLEHADSSDTVAKIYDSGDDGVLELYMNQQNIVRLHANGDSFIGGQLGIGGGAENPHVPLDVKGNIASTGYVSASMGFSGSLTQLVDGTSYILAGNNVTVTSASNGAVTIASSGGGSPGGSDTEVQFNSSDAFGGDGNFTWNETTRTLTSKHVDVSKDLKVTAAIYSLGSLHLSGTVSEFTATGSARFTAGLSGSLTQLTNGSSYLVAGSNVTITSASNGAVTIASTGGGSIDGSGAATRIAYWSDADTLTSDSDLIFDGDTLTSANSSNTAIPAIKIDRNYTGTTDIGNYTTDPQGLLIDYDVTGIVAADQTAIHDAIAIHYNQDSPTMVGTVNATGADIRMTGGTSGTQAMKGVAISLTGADTNTGIDITVPNDGTHIVARSPDNILDQFKISVGAAGATTLSTNDNDGSVGHLTLDADGKIIINALAGKEVVFNEANENVDFRVESSSKTHMLFVDGAIEKIGIGTDSPKHTLSIVGAVSASLGLSGSLTRLVDGTSYLRAGSNITVTSASNGAVTIAASGGSVAGGNAEVQFNDGGSAFGAETTFTFNKATSTLTVTNVDAAESLKITGNALTASDGGTPIVWDTADNVIVGGDLKINGNDIRDSGGNTMITMDGSATYVKLGGNLQLGSAGIIQNSLGQDCMTVDSNKNITAGAGIKITNNAITASDGGTPIVWDTDDNVSVAGELRVTGSMTSLAGLSGSITRLTDGTSYIIAGSNVTVTSASNGAVTIASTGGGGSPGGSDTQVQFNDGSSFGGDPAFTFNKVTETLVAVNIEAAESLKITNNAITASDGGVPIRWNTSDNVTIAGDLIVGGNDIKKSGGDTSITMTGTGIELAGNLQLGTTGIIKNSLGQDSITIDENKDVIFGAGITIINNALTASDGGTPIIWDTLDNVTIAGDLTVVGNDIKKSGGDTSITLASTGIELGGNLQLGTTGIIKNSLGQDCMTVDVNKDVTFAAGITVANNALTASDGGTPIVWDTSDNIFLGGSSAVDADIVLKPDGGAIFNSMAATLANASFTIKTDGNIDTFIVDATTSQVLVGTPTAKTDTFFSVSGSTGTRQTSHKGTAVFGGDLVCSGTVYATLSNFYHFSANIADNVENYFKAGGNDATGIFDVAESQFIAPYSGKLKTIIVRSDTADVDDAIAIKFYRSAGGSANSGGTSQTQNFMVNNTTIAYTQTGIDHDLFQGDSLALSVQRTDTAPGKVNVTLVIDYEVDNI